MGWHSIKCNLLIQAYKVQQELKYLLNTVECYMRSKKEVWKNIYHTAVKC